MEGSPESGVDLEKRGLTRCPTEEEYGQERRRSVETDKVSHHIWVYLSAYWRGGMGKDSDHNFKMATKGIIGINPGPQGVAK